VGLDASVSTWGSDGRDSLPTGGGMSGSFCHINNTCIKRFISRKSGVQKCITADINNNNFQLPIIGITNYWNYQLLKLPIVGITNNWYLLVVRLVRFLNWKTEPKLKKTKRWNYIQLALFIDPIITQ